MDKMSFNAILQREEIANEIKKILTSQEHTMENMSIKKGIYLFGSSGCGKTEFITNLLNELNYDVIKYDAGDVRNKSLFETMTSDNMSTHSVLDMMNKTKKKIAVVMDEVDGMNNGDKGGITSLMKLMRHKKTKKQKLEDSTKNTIICISDCNVDKKIKDLMKVCNVFELKTPTTKQISQLLEIHTQSFIIADENTKTQMLNYIQGDLRKLNFVIKMCETNPQFFTTTSLFCKKTFNENAKNTTKNLLNEHHPIETHNTAINETDRTIVGLLWHENVIDMLEKTKSSVSVPFYVKIAENTRFADCMDRMTFQNQTWQFNEMTSFIKTFYNNKIYHETFPQNKGCYNPEEIRFTKILTKCSTEHNNALFLKKMCQELCLDRKDLTTLFQGLRLIYNKNNENNKYKNEKQRDISQEIEFLFKQYEITKFDIKRIYRIIDKTVKKEAIEEEIIEETCYDEII